MNMKAAGIVESIKIQLLCLISWETDRKKQKSSYSQTKTGVVNLVLISLFFFRY